jgi:hypothetical protein
MNSELHAYCGFVFAFFKYSKKANNSMFETMVHYALRSDIIHVAVIPAPKVYTLANGQVLHATLGKSVFTAFMGYGFEKEDVESVMGPEYERIFVPTTPEAFVRGVHFLVGLVGKAYNYVDLPLTILPHAWKMRTHIAPQKFEKGQSRVFCSQVGLMLCYVCEIIGTEHNEDPACCAPSDLYELVLQKGNGQKLANVAIDIVVSE